MYVLDKINFLSWINLSGHKDALPPSSEDVL